MHQRFPKVFAIGMPVFIHDNNYDQDHNHHNHHDQGDNLQPTTRSTINNITTTDYYPSNTRWKGPPPQYQYDDGIDAFTTLLSKCPLQFACGVIAFPSPPQGEEINTTPQPFGFRCVSMDVGGSPFRVPRVDLACLRAPLRCHWAPLGHLGLPRGAS